MNTFLRQEEISAQLLNAGSMFHLYFQEESIDSSRDILGGTAQLENEFYLHLLNHGVIVPGIHLAFISAAHTEACVDQVIAAFIQSFKDLRRCGQLS